MKTYHGACVPCARGKVLRDFWLVEKRSTRGAVMPSVSPCGSEAQRRPRRDFGILDTCSNP